MSAARFVVVGIGADGWLGLTDRARAELSSASMIIGSARQAAFLVGHTDAEVLTWRSPMSRHLDDLVDDAHTGTVHVVASGDPMFHGVGASLVARVGSELVDVIPAVSSVSLAAARMGWDLARTDVVSLVRAAAQTVLAAADDGARMLVLSRDEHSPTQVAEVLSDNGFGDSAMTVLEQLGGSGERCVTGLVGNWASQPVDPLNVIALDLRGPARVQTPGLPDDDFEHDGQLTKQVIRSVTVCALAPTAGQLLWDVGAGSGSIGIEWLRMNKTGQAVAFESNTRRAERVIANAARHGVADRLQSVGAAPQAFRDAPDPDVVFVGGGLSDEMFDAVWARLRPGGRLVVNAVTVENQSLVAKVYAAHGGSMVRLNLEYAAPLGSMTTWRPALPIVQWAVEKRGDAQ